MLALIEKFECIMWFLNIGMVGNLRLRVGVLNSLKIVEKAKQEASQEVAY